MLIEFKTTFNILVTPVKTKIKQLFQSHTRFIQRQIFRQSVFKASTNKALPSIQALLALDGRAKLVLTLKKQPWYNIAFQLERFV